MKKAAVPSILVAVVLLALGVIAEAQQPKKVPRIGYLSNSDPARDSTRAEGIRLALRERGHIEGQNIAMRARLLALADWGRFQGQKRAFPIRFGEVGPVLLCGTARDRKKVSWPALGPALFSGPALPTP